MAAFFTEQLQSYTVICCHVYAHDDKPKFEIHAFFFLPSPVENICLALFTLISVCVLFGAKQVMYKQCLELF